jgi:EAL domain-containing protein (putative c-di-GMP-specific phosphodiesterase class I)
MREFELVYQPQLNLETNRLVGCEALIRWRHPTRGTLLPENFIPLAEEIGLIIPIGEWVVRTACRDAVRWPGDLWISVNLSPAQFKSKTLVDKVRSALLESGLAPHRLEVAITEGVLLQDNDENLKTLHALRDLGLRISMDEFGTGYSSLSYLRSFPFDKIKIDKSFISSGTTSPDSMAIVRAIASLGASFGMTTVAEGIETTDQMRCIRNEGCNDVQGYLTSHPMPVSELMSLLKS